jgi:hypothetical protein
MLDFRIVRIIPTGWVLEIPPIREQNAAVLCRHPNVASKSKRVGLMKFLQIFSRSPGCRAKVGRVELPFRGSAL